MLANLGFREILLMMAIIAILSMTGLWPRIVRGLRELFSAAAPESTAIPGRPDDICYQILGLTPSATWPEIEQAYRQKAKVHHPDRGGDSDAMRALNDAYAKLKKRHRP